MVIDLDDDSGIDPTQYQALLDDLQGNILKGHGREHVRLLLIKFNDDRRGAKNWVSWLGRELVTSASAQMAQTRRFHLRENRASEDVRSATDRARYEVGRDHLFASLFLTARGYRHIDVDGNLWVPGEPKFEQGMLGSQALLNDPPGEAWKPPYDSADALHAMVLLASDTVELLELKTRTVSDSLAQITKSIYPQAGRACKDKAKKEGRERYIEHFNYLDGRSQPLFFREDLDDEEDCDGTSEFRPNAPLRLVLVKDDNGGEHGYGSYLVYRKLEQNVRRFKEQERKPDASVADQLDLKSEEDRKRVGAMIVGRFENGTPLALAARGSLRSAPNNFNYDDDATGSKCPLFAHIRKVNPRTKASRRHRIVRRGIPYEDPLRAVPPADDPTYEQMPERGVGLLFMCFQRSIKEQFEQLQQFANKPDLPVPKSGVDPLAGQCTDGTPSPQWVQRWGTVGSTTVPFAPCVRLMHGEYFFAPCLSFFKRLQ